MQAQNDIAQQAAESKQAVERKADEKKNAAEKAAADRKKIVDRQERTARQAALTRESRQSPPNAPVVVAPSLAPHDRERDEEGNEPRRHDCG